MQEFEKINSYQKLFKIILNIVFSIPIILLSFGFSYFLFNTNLKQFYKATDEKLKIAAYSVKHILPNDYHDRILDATSVSKEEFTELKEQLNKYTYEIQIDYVYSMLKKDGKFYFTSANSKVKDVIWRLDPQFFDEYEEGRIGDISKLNMNSNQPQLIRTVDKWGEFRTIIIPVKSKTGREYILGADISITNLQKTIQILFILTSLFGIIILIPSLIITFDFVNQGRVYQYIFLQRKRRLIYISLTISILITIVFGIYYYSQKKEQTYGAIDSILFTGASSLKNILPRNYHQNLDSISNDFYQEIKQNINEFVNEIGFAYLYSMVENSGKFYYTASNVPKSDIEKGIETTFLQEVTAFPETLKEAVNKNKISFFNEYNTKWGSFRRIVIPVKSIARKEYLIAADIGLKEIEDSIQKVYLEIAIIVFALLLFSFLTTTKLLIALADIGIQGNWEKWFSFVSLKVKLGFFISGIIVACLVSVSYIYLYNSKIILQKKTIEVCRNFATNISNIAREDLIEDTTYNATNLAVSEILTSDIEGLIDVYIINVYGKYVVDFNKVKLNEYAPETLISYIQSIHSIDLTEEYSSQTNRNILKISYPIFIDYNNQPIKIGVAIFEYDRDVIYQPVYEMQSAVIFTGIFALVITLLLTRFLAAYITKPLLALEKGAQIIAAGNLDHEIPVNTNDEVGLLSKRFNEMSLNLKKSYDELEEKVIERTADLVKSQATLITVLSNAPLILFSADTNGIITISEGQSLNLIGIGSGQAVGVSIYEMFEDNPEVLNAIDSALRGEIKILKLKIEQFTFEVNYSPLYNIENKIVGLISVYFDVTENLKAQEIINREKEESDRLLLNILPEKIANELKEKGSVKPVLYDSITVIFTDFKGFTKIASNMLPEELLEKLDMIFLQFDQICERRKIEKLKTIGDAYMCAGGLPEINHTHPIDACLAAIEMQNFMNETKTIIEQISEEEFWDMRLGIHTGTVVAGVIGKTKFAYDVWGDAVNTASRMESNGSIGKINISHATYNQVKDFFDCEYRGKIEAKNKGMIDMYFLLRIKPELSRDEAGVIPNDEFMELYNKISI